MFFEKLIEEKSIFKLFYITESEKEEHDRSIPDQLETMWYNENPPGKCEHTQHKQYKSQSVGFLLVYISIRRDLG